jgi:hypothetical protein
MDIPARKRKTEDDQIIIDRQKDVRSCRKMDGPSLDGRKFYFTTTIRIQPSAWMRLRRKCRLMAIQGSIGIISRNIRGNREMDEDPPSTQPSP